MVVTQGPNPPITRIAQGHLDDLEREQGAHGTSLYVIFPDAGGSWCCARALCLIAPT